MSHEECVNLIKRAGNTLALKIVTANMPSMIYSHHDSPSNYSGSQSLPYRRKGRIFFSFLFMKIKKYISAALHLSCERPFGGRFTDFVFSITKFLFYFLFY